MHRKKHKVQDVQFLLNLQRALHVVYIIDNMSALYIHTCTHCVHCSNQPVTILAFKTCHKFYLYFYSKQVLGSNPARVACEVFAQTL